MKTGIRMITGLLVTLLTGLMLCGCTDQVKVNVVDGRENTGAGLEYWTEGSKAAASIQEYVEEVTDKDSEKYIPVEDRIAVFDLDGTIIGELYPSYFEYMMFIHRALYDEDYEAPEDMKEFATALEEGIKTGDIPKNSDRIHAEFAGKAYAGMTIDELKAYTKEFMKSKAEGFNNLTRGDAFYKPMVSLVEYLKANDFDCYIVSGSDRTVVRALIEDKLPIPENKVIGMSYTMVASNQDGADGLDYLYTEDDDVILGGDLIIKTIKMNKVSEIALEIGKVPVLCFGNSSGDLSMGQYTVNNDKYEGRAYMVLCDDYEREYGNYEKYQPLAEFCEEHGFGTISMCEDFATIYGDDVTLDHERENDIFDITMPEELEGTYKVESRQNGYVVYDLEANEAGFGGYAFSVYAYKDPSEYAGGLDMKRGEIKKGNETLYDIVVEYPSDVQYDYTKYEDGMPDSYKALYDGAEDIIKTLVPKGEGEYVHGAGCKGEDMYSDVLKKYVKAVKGKWDSNKLEEEDMSPEYNAINVATGGDAINNVGYAYFDVNNDGIDELLIGEIAEGDLKGTVYDIYTMEDREPVHVLSGTGRNRYYALEYGMICNERSLGAGAMEWQSYDIEPNTVNLLPQLGVKEDAYEDMNSPWSVNFGSEDEWEKIDEEAFDDYKSRFEYVRFDFTPLAKAS
ncbi:MAG: haloacid dehalogenase-like hydrolase [Lachnospiraceae bacterium]|nr:haloacid dehalogenase-like hydrolase [Lachnospiraceae bacterium]